METSSVDEGLRKRETSSQEDEIRVLQEEVDAEKRVVEALQAEYNKALEELRCLLQRQADLQALSADLDAHAHNFE